MESILEIVAIVSCLCAVAYPLATAKYYIGTTELGKVQMLMFIGEAIIMSITSVFAILAFSGLLPEVSENIQSSMRILMSGIAIYTSYRVHRVLRKIVPTKI